MPDPGTKQAIARGCKCSKEQPADGNTWLIAIGCPLHDNVPDHIRELMQPTRKAQEDFKGVTDDDGLCD